MKKAFSKLHLRGSNKNAKEKAVAPVEAAQPSSLSVAEISNAGIQQDHEDTSRSMSTGTTTAHSSGEQLHCQYDSRASQG